MIRSGIFDFCRKMVKKVQKMHFLHFFNFFFALFDKNRKFRFLAYLPTDLSFHLSHQPGWSDECGVRYFNFREKSFEFFFRNFGKSPKSRQKFWIFLYQWIAFVHTKILIPHSSSLDMCVRHSSALKSKSVKIRISS